MAGIPVINNMINNGPFNGQQIFVSQAFGHDFNSGSYGAPLATIGAAVALANTPDIYISINILDGHTYNENVVLTDFMCLNGPYATLSASSGDSLTVNLSDSHGIIFVNLATLDAGEGGNSLVVNSGNLYLTCNNTLNSHISNSAGLYINATQFLASVSSNTGNINYTCLGSAPSPVGTMTGFSTGTSSTTNGISANGDITTVGNFATTNTGYIQAFHGNVIAGDAAGNAGSFITYSGTGATGSLTIEATANTTNVASILTNQPTSFSIQYQLPLLGFTTVTLLAANLAQTDPNANIISYDADVTAAALMGGGSIPITFTYFGGQYRIREMYINSNTTNFSGGDRDLNITDGTTVYSQIPSSTLLALSNDRWGSASFPFPASTAINTLTQPGADLNVIYTGGTTDYAAGDISLTVIWEKVV
jgi:hypothetical protein